MDYRDYYKGQLDLIDKGVPCQIVLSDDNNNKTKYLTLNKDSIKELIIFLQELDKKL
jgi:hypothetical protein